MKIAVVIPFFQRESGILRKAIDSVLAQELAAGVTASIVVVDDGSPVSPEPDLAHLAAEQRAAVTVLRQPNAGPGAARNRALDHVAATGADYVAFLDSDDIWKPQHLRDATEALAMGYDFYFCDHTRFDSASSYADLLPALAAIRDPAVKGHMVIDSAGPVLTAAPDAMLEAFTTDYLCQTSTVVLRQSAVRTLRFDCQLRGAGEDHLFWIALCAEGARVAMSWRVNVLCGRGVNLYFDSFDFATVRAVNRIGYICLLSCKCQDLLPRSANSKSHVQKARIYMRGYSYMFIRALLRGQRPDLRLFRALWRRYPFMPLAMPFRFLAVLPHREREFRLW